MRKTVDECDVCGANRGIGNHWKLMNTRPNASPTFLPWDNGRANRKGQKFCCSQKCAHSALDAWFSEQQAARTMPAGKVATIG